MKPQCACAKRRKIGSLFGGPSSVSQLMESRRHLDALNPLKNGAAPRDSGTSYFLSDNALIALSIAMKLSNDSSDTSITALNTSVGRVPLNLVKFV